MVKLIKCKPIDGVSNIKFNVHSIGNDGYETLYAEVYAPTLLGAVNELIFSINNCRHLATDGAYKQVDDIIMLLARNTRYDFEF